MAWKCPDCEEINSDNNLLRCICGYELDELEEPEYVEATLVKVGDREIYTLLLFAWPFMPAILMLLNVEVIYILLLFPGAIVWSFIGLLLFLIPYFHRAIKSTSIAIIINIFGLIFWTGLTIYVWLNSKM